MGEEHKVFIPEGDFPPGTSIPHCLLGQHGQNKAQLDHDLGVKVELRGRGSGRDEGGQLHFAVAASANSEQHLKKVRAFVESCRKEVSGDYERGGQRQFLPPGTLEQLLYNCYTLCKANRDLSVQNMVEGYHKHFLHPFQPDAFLPIPAQGLKGVFKEFPHLFSVEKLPDGTARLKTVLAKTLSFEAFCALHKAVPDRHAKRRRVAEIADPVLLNSALRGIHACLKEAASGLALPTREVEAVFLEYWKIPLNVRYFGDVTPASFLRQFPQVFDVSFDGLQWVVLPRANPRFPDGLEDEYDPLQDEQTAEAKAEEAGPGPENDTDVVQGALQQLVAMLGSLTDAPTSTKRRCLPQLVQVLSDNRKQKHVVDDLVRQLCEDPMTGMKGMKGGRW